MSRLRDVKYRPAPFNDVPDENPASRVGYFICWLVGHHWPVFYYDSSGYCRRCGVTF